MNYLNKVAIVTGSSRGIGKALALRLAHLGANVVINGRDNERLSLLEKELFSITKNVLAICVDISSENGAKELIQKTIDEFGKIDILINNVGVSSRGVLADLSPLVLKKVFESNVYGTIFPSIYAIPYLRLTQGSVVFISSLAGIRGLPGLAPYCASKMALRAFVESIRIEEKPNNIHAGLLLVGITEIEHDKETIGADGSLKVLSSRSGKKVLSMDEVAKATITLINKRAFIKTMTNLGKMNAFLHARCPKLVEWLILKNSHKFEEGNK